MTEQVWLVQIYGKLWSCAVGPLRQGQGQAGQGRNVSAMRKFCLSLWCSRTSSLKWHHAVNCSIQTPCLGNSSAFSWRCHFSQKLFIISKAFRLPKRTYWFSSPLPPLSRRQFTWCWPWGTSDCAFHDLSQFAFKLSQSGVLLTYDLSLLKQFLILVLELFLLLLNFGAKLWNFTPQHSHTCTIGFNLLLEFGDLLPWWILFGEELHCC